MNKPVFSSSLDSLRMPCVLCFPKWERYNCPAEFQMIAAMERKCPEFNPCVSKKRKTSLGCYKCIDLEACRRQRQRYKLVDDDKDKK